MACHGMPVDRLSCLCWCAAMRYDRTGACEEAEAGATAARLAAAAAAAMTVALVTEKVSRDGLRFLVGPPAPEKAAVLGESADLAAGRFAASLPALRREMPG